MTSGNIIHISLMLFMRQKDTTDSDINLAFASDIWSTERELLFNSHQLLTHKVLLVFHFHRIRAIVGSDILA